MTAATARLTSLERDGMTFDVYDEGPAGGEVVVLLHGFPERSSMWADVAPLLHAQGYRTVAMDQRGYSAGARPRRRRDYTLPLLVGDVAALVERIGGRVHLVGHDWGAAVGWAVAMQRPELLHTLTALSVPHPKAMMGAALTSRQLLRSWYILFFQLPVLPELAARIRGGPVDRSLRGMGMTDDEVALFRAEMVDDGAFSPALGWYRAVPFADRSLLSQQVGVPTTFVWSDGDGAIDRSGAESTAAYVDAAYEFVELAGLSHWIHTHAPETCAEIILRRARGGAA